jgi:hypothetical protein
MKQLLQITILSLLMAFISCSNGLNDTVGVDSFSNVKMSAFSINGVSGSIEKDTIHITLPKDTDPGELVAEFTSNGSIVKVNDIQQQTGISKNDFSMPVEYIIQNDNGVTRKYTVIVNLETWEKTYGGTGNDNVSIMRETSDGGYIIAGYTESTNYDVTGHRGKKDAWILKINVAGHIDWQRCIGGSEDDEARDIQQLSDNGFIVSGYSQSKDGDITDNQGGKDYLIVRLDKNGNILWTKTFGGSGDEEAKGITLTSDGNYMAIGHTSSNDGDVSGNHGGDDIWAVSISQTGNLIKQTCFGGTGNDYGTKIIQTRDRGLAFCGYSDSNNGDIPGNLGSNDSIIMKLNKNGTKEWVKNYGGLLDEAVFDIIETSNSDLVLTGQLIGYEPRNDSLHSHILVLRYTNAGNLVYGKLYNVEIYHTDRKNWYVDTFNDVGTRIFETNDNGLLIGGFSQGNFFYDTQHITLIKTDSDGTEEWRKTYGGKSFDYCRGIYQQLNGKFMIAGHTSSTDGDISYNHGKSDFWILQLDESGNL